MSELVIPSFRDFLLKPERLAWVQASHPARKGTLPAPPSFRSAMDALVRRYQREEQQPGVNSFAVVGGEPCLGGWPNGCVGCVHREDP